MSVVSRQAHRRWAAVVAGIAVLAVLPTTTSVASSWVGSAAVARPTPRVLLARALASARVAHSGLAESRGDLGLPDLPRLEDVTAEFGGTTTTQIWWAGPASWRSDVIDSTGEQDTYQTGAGTVLWDYEQARLTRVFGSPTVRLPRPDDLLPPQAARRVLAGVGPRDHLEALPGNRSIAGIRAEGVRIVPADPRSTIGHVDVWLDPVHGLPLAIEAADRKGVVAFESQFLQVHFGPPRASALRVPSAPGAVHDTSAAPDLVSRIERFGIWQPPDTLAGLPASEQILGGTSTYGSGLVRLVVLPLPPGLAGQALDSIRSGGGAPLPLSGGEGILLSSGMVNLVVLRATDHRHAYLAVGLVTPQLVTTAARQLLANLPSDRSPAQPR